MSLPFVMNCFVFIDSLLALSLGAVPASMDSITALGDLSFESSINFSLPLFRLRPTFLSKTHEIYP